MSLEHQLDRLANRTPQSDPVELFAAARGRAARTSAGQPRRSRRLLATAAAAAAVTALAFGAANILTDNGRDAVTVAGPVQQPDERESQADVDAMDAPRQVPVPTYDLDLEGAELVEDYPHTATNTDVVLWSDGRGAYLSLTARPGTAGTYDEPAGLGPMVRDEEFPEDRGEAWHSKPQDPHAAAMWWVQPSGDLWILRAHWYGDTVPETPKNALREWALGVDFAPESIPPYIASDRGLTVIAYESAGDRPSRSRVWEYEGHEIVLLVHEGSAAAGRSNLLAGGAPTITEVPALGQVWSVDSTVGWSLNRPKGAWATLTIPEELTGRTSDILAALRPADQ